MSLLDLFFPAFCLNCEEGLLRKEKLLCSSCLSQLNFELEPQPLTPFAFLLPLWEAKGAPERLVQSFKGGKKYLARGLASFIILRFLKLEIDKPDLITYIPTEPHIKWALGFCPKKLLAHELSKQWGIPAKSLLKWEGEELKLDRSQIAQRILLFDDYAENYDLLRAAGSELYELKCKTLIGLVLTTRVDSIDKAC